MYPSLQIILLILYQLHHTIYEIAQFLESSNKVKSIYYPGLSSHPNHHIAKKQQLDPNKKPVFGGMISIDLGSLLKAKKFVKNLNIFTLAESLGGVESLVCHPSSMTHASMPTKVKSKVGITNGLLRLSIGIEDVNDLISDLKNAISKI